MAASNIQSKVKAGLAKAVKATGSSASQLVYLVSNDAQQSTPLNPQAGRETYVLLPNAVFKSYDAKMFNETILAGDRMLVSDNDNAIKQGDTISQGEWFYKVVSVDIKAPTSETLVYISQVRLK